MWSTAAFLMAALTPSLTADEAVRARPVATYRMTRIRPVDRWTTKILDEGLARSPTLRRLFDQLNAGDAIVYIESGFAVSRGTPAHLQFVSDSGGQRYLRIRINLTGDRLAVTMLLAHELHHALEVVAHPEVIDQRSMERLYKQIG